MTDSSTRVAGVSHGLADSKSILIVDDSDLVRSVIRMFIDGQAGCTVVGEAANGTEAIDKAKELGPDLVILDLAMPGMNGVETAAVLKSYLPKVKIILFTMYSESMGRSLASAVGIDDVVSKPDGIGKLIERVQYYISPDYTAPA